LYDPLGLAESDGYLERGEQLMRFLSLARLAIVTIFALSVGLNVMAHHGWADFDRSKRVEISGIILESKYENPHTFVRVRVEQSEWAVELSAVPRMRRNGITPEMIKPGTRVSLVGHPHKKKPQLMKRFR
jgi:hypothetical protein